MPRRVTWNPKSLFETCLDLIAYRVKDYDPNVQVSTSLSNLVEDGKSVSNSAMNSFGELRESLFALTSCYYFYLCSHILIFIFILAAYFLEQIIDVFKSKGWLNLNYQDLLVAANTRKLDISYDEWCLDYKNTSFLYLELAAIRCQVYAGIQLFLFS